VLPEGDASASAPIAAGASEQSEAAVNTRKASDDAAPEKVKRKCVPPVRDPQFAPSDLGGPLSRTLSLPGLGAGLGRDLLA
jgi:hypothetical protein